MFIRSVKTLVLAAALVLSFSLPAAAQQLGAGISFFEGAVGGTIDYSKAYKTLSNDRTLGWVGDVSFHHEGEDGVSVNWLSLQGGVRLTGKASEKLRWHVQGLVGILRGSASTDLGDVIEDICDDLDIDCDASGSDTSFVFSPGAGIDYIIDEKKAFRVQLDLPFNADNSGTRFWFGLSLNLGR